MENYHLYSDETVLVEIQGALREINSFKTETGNLVLTNRDIIWATKNFFGKLANFQRFPITDLKVFNGEVQIKAVNRHKLTFNRETKEYCNAQFFFTNTQMEFGQVEYYQVRDILRYVTPILTHQEYYEPEESLPKKSFAAIPGAQFVARTLKGTVDTFKETFSEGKTVQSQETVSRFCSQCGASVQGIKGRTVYCQYCGTAITLK